MSEALKWIAEGAAAALVHVVGACRTEVIIGTPTQEFCGPVWLGTDSVLLPPFGGAEEAEHAAAKARRILAGAILAAMEGTVLRLWQRAEATGRGFRLERIAPTTYPSDVKGMRGEAPEGCPRGSLYRARIGRGRWFYADSPAVALAKALEEARPLPAA